MQSKTSFFNRTVFRKDMTRFAPVWGTATLGLLMMLLMMSGFETNFGYELMVDMAELFQILAIANCGYALLNAQLLFGDLYSTRSCYSLHAMPLRRESWYLTHVVSALVFSLIPTAVMTLAAIPVAMSTCVVNAWQIPLYLFLGSNMQYICMFGIAVLCTFCAGSRVGMIGMYGFANLIAALVGLFAEYVCMPLYFGVVFSWWKLLIFSPAMEMFNTSPVAINGGDFYELLNKWEQGDHSVEISANFIHRPEMWSYYGICAILGVVLLIVGLVLYKKRKLECAGDFLAFRKLAPIGTVLASLSVAMIFQVIYTISTDGRKPFYLFLFVGLAIGWFVVRMLLERTTRVFRKKSFLGLGALALAAALSMGLIHMDPLGRVNWVPEAEEVQSASFGRYWQRADSITDKEEIAQLLRLHELALEQHLAGDWSGGYNYATYEPGVGFPEDSRYGLDVEIEYTMADGSVRSRRYVVYADSEAGQIAGRFMSKPEIAMSGDPNTLEPEKLKFLEINGFPVSQEFSSLTEVTSLFEAIRADCEAKHMAQLDELHTGYFSWEEVDRFGEKVEGKDPSLRLTLRGEEDDYYAGYFYISVYSECENTLKWLNDRGLLDQLGITVVETDEYFSRYSETFQD